MALTFDINTTDSLSLAEYIEYIDNGVDIRDDDAIANSAPYFRALLNNPHVITDVLNKELRRWRNFQATNSYSAQTFVLGSGSKQGFFIRANMWMPAVSKMGSTDWERRMYAYEMAHDHNFVFMTGGYLGSGYRTSIYEYDHSKVKGEPGERIDLRFLERTSLPVGKIMQYRASKDVHVQDFPDDLSLSINLMIPTNSSLQLYFDIDDDQNAQIAKPTRDTVAGIGTLMDLATHFCNEETPALLAAAKEHAADAPMRAMMERAAVSCKLKMGLLAG